MSKSVPSIVSPKIGSFGARMVMPTAKLPTIVILGTFIHAPNYAAIARRGWLSSLISPRSSPEIRPFRMTSTRSAFVISSAISEVIRTIATPSARDAAQDRVDLRLGADIDAARRLVQDEHARIGDEAAAEKDLLLIAARQRAELLSPRLPIRACEPRDLGARLPAGWRRAGARRRRRILRQRRRIRHCRRWSWREGRRRRAGRRARRTSRSEWRRARSAARSPRRRSRPGPRAVAKAEQASPRASLPESGRPPRRESRPNGPRS